MAEIKKFYICRDPEKIDGSFDHYFEDPAIKDEEHRLQQIMSESEGRSIHGLVRVYMGTGQDRWEKEHTKVYDDFASARADAVKRMAKVEKQYKAKKKTASDPVASKVAARFKSAK